MNKTTKLDKDILHYWEELGISKPPGELVTHKDINQVNIEIKTILSLLKNDDTLLDVGCGNGFSTSLYARKCLKTVGMDYSSNMIESARNAYKIKNLSFDVGDVLNLDSRYKTGSFSVIVCTRCLINLTSWDEQKKAIMNMHRLLKKGGRLILTEGIKQGRDNLNELREELGLPAMPSVWHNLDFDEDKLFPFLEELFTIGEKTRFGLYDVLTRVNYPACIYPEEPAYRTRYQDVAERLFYLFRDNVWNKYGREACLELVKK